MSKALEGLNIVEFAHVHAAPFERRVFGKARLAPNRDMPETDFPDTGSACYMVVVGWW
jgi:hypothetical protein